MPLHFFTKGGAEFMPLDSITVSALAQELDLKLRGCRIDKVYQPSKLGFSLAVRTDGGNMRLNICCSDRPYVCLSAQKPENPDVSPMFCMLLRKHLTSARILSVKQPRFERIINFDLECSDELGGKSRKTLIAELIGRHSNLILTDAEGRIIDCARRVGYETSELRQLLPNLFYQLPPAPEKAETTAGITDRDAVLRLMDSAEASIPAWQWLCDNFFGLCPLICREAVFDACGNVRALLGDMNGGQRQKLADLIISIKKDDFICRPYLLIKNGENTAFDFSFMPIRQYGDEVILKKCDDFCAMLSEFYDKREAQTQLRAKKRTIAKTLSAAIKRTERKLTAQTAELAQAHEREYLRRYADLIMANMHNIKKGAENAEVADLFEPEQPIVKIPLDPALDPHKNALKYYREYAKRKNAEIFLSAEIERVGSELEYLKSVADALERCDQSGVILQIQDELTDSGYIRRPAGKSGKGSPKKSKQPAFCPKEYKTADGFIIKAGRSNRENEYLSLKYAAADDLWFHVKNTGGSHVLLLCRDGVQPSDSAVNDAAMLAAYHSSLRGASNVAVDYTKAKYVKKLHGGAPGMVNYYEYKTVYATPDERQEEKMRRAAQESGES